MVQPEFYEATIILFVCKEKLCNDFNTLISSVSVFDTRLQEHPQHMHYMGITCTILTKSLLPCWALKIVTVLLSMEGHKAIG